MAESLEQQRHNLTHAIGECILAWSQVEQALSMVYCNFMGRDAMDFIPDLMSFEAVISLETRLSLIDEACQWHKLEISLEKTIEIRDKWKNLKNRVTKKYKRRHMIAHAAIIEMPSDSKRGAICVLPFPTIRNALGVYLPRLSEHIQTLAN